jgi:hypothetical protein
LPNGNVGIKIKDVQDKVAPKVSPLIDFDPVWSYL